MTASADGGVPGLTATEARVLAQVDRQSLLDDLSALVAVPSLDGSESPAQEVAAGLMTEHGMRAHRWPIDLDAVRAHPAFSAEAERSEAIGLVGELGGNGGGRDLILNAHIDVVPPGDLSAWSSDPWQATVVGDRVVGRGALDDKGGLTCALQAARAIAAAGVRLRGRLLVESVVSEEDGGTGTLGTLLAGFTADGAVVVEPTALAICPAQAGSLTFRLTVHGAAAHGCVRGEGVSAVEKFVLLHEALLNLERERNLAVRDALFAGVPLPIPLSIGTVQAGDWPSTVPERLVCEGRYGVAVGETVAQAQAAFERAVAAAAAADPWLRDHPPEIEWWGGRFESAQTASDDPVVTTLAGAATAVMGQEPQRRGVTYGADMRLLVNVGHIPTVLFGPGDVRAAHRPNESVPIADLIKASEALALTALRFCGYEA